MKNILILLTVFILFSCGEGDDNHVDPEPEPVTTLIISNQNDNVSIREVSLVGYEFKDIKIDYGQIRGFTLDDGLNGGWNGVNINVRFYCGARYWNGSVTKNFTEGESTKVTVVDCFPNGQGGCTEVCYQ